LLGDEKVELPYCAIDISTDDGKMKLIVTAVNKGPSEFLKVGGLTADFNIKVVVKGIIADFKCYISVGNLYEFYKELKKCYNNLCGNAVLRDYSGKLTNIYVDFDKIGRCIIRGYIQNGAYSENGIGFCLRCDQSYIAPVINSLGRLFNELAELQGIHEFPV